jgi:hypothetical protein
LYIVENFITFTKLQLTSTHAKAKGITFSVQVVCKWERGDEFE